MNTNVEFLIVGQGLAGTMLAFELLENNIDFKIVASSQKSNASLVAAGMINPLVFKRLTKSWMVDQLLPVMESTYRKLETTLVKRFFFSKDILKPLSNQEKKLWEERMLKPEYAKYIKAIDNNAGMDYLQKAEAYGRISGSGYIDMKLFLEVSEKYFRDKNLMIDTEFDFHEIDMFADSFQIGNIVTANLIFCEGYHVIHNPLFHFVKMKPTKGEVLLIYSPELSEEFILNKKVFILPVGNHYFKIGSTYEWQDLTEETTKDGKKSISERLEFLISAPYSIVGHWAGVRPTIADRRPVLGFHPKNSNISLFNGLGTKGAMLAPFFAKEMSNYLTTNSYSLNKEVEIERFWKV